MKKKKLLNSKTAWYHHLLPLIAAMFPVFSMVLENITNILFSSIVRSMLISILAVYVFYVLIYLLIKEWLKAGLIASTLVLILQSYGKIFLFIKEKFGSAPNHLLFSLLVFLIFLIIVKTIFKVKEIKNAHMAILVSVSVICVYLLFLNGVYKFMQNKAEKKLVDKRTTSLVGLGDTSFETFPDIYLIILDAHTRSDVLENSFGYNNSDFISKLDELGFWTAKCAQSNYPITKMSLASLFEMNYVHNMFGDNKNLVFPPFDTTRAIKNIKTLGYKTAIFDNYFFDHFVIEEDFIYSADDSFFGSINEFEQLMIDTSILRIIVDGEGFFPDSWVSLFKYGIHKANYRDSVYALEILPDLPMMDEQLFVYAHLMVTHDPFVFLPDGSFVTSEQGYETGYRNAVKFIDTTLPDILEEIINNSEEPPIIILMGDHGATMPEVTVEERLSILYSIYFQGEEPSEFHDNLTPVNTFPMIFNYLGFDQMDLLEDLSFGILDTAEIKNNSEPVFVPCE